MADNDTLVAVERREDGVAVVTLQNPKVNALSSELLRQLRAAADDLTQDPPGAVVVTGGERVFAAGADITEFAGTDEAQVIGRLFLEALDAVAAIPRATIAAVAGFALGGGCELAMMCDIVVAAETARFGQPEIKLGIIPGAGGTQRLPRAVGKAKAMDLVLTGRMMDVHEAERAGLVSRIVPADKVVDEALAVGAAICALSGPSLEVAKACLNKAYEGGLRDGVDYERRLFWSLFATEDQKEGMAAFVEKRPPAFRQR